MKHDIQSSTFNKPLLGILLSLPWSLTLSILTAKKNEMEQNKTPIVTRKTQNTFFRGEVIAEFNYFLKPF